MWYIGQKVICVKARLNIPIKEGKIYTIIGIYECSCGRIKLDIGETVGMISMGTRCDCGKCIFTFIWHFDSCRFCPIDSYLIPNKEIIGNLIEERQDIQIKEPQKV